jgi:hypothetical protein
LIEKRHDILPFDTLIHLDPQALPTEDVHDAQHPEPPSIKKSVRSKIHTPTVVDILRILTHQPETPSGTLPDLLPTNIEPLFAVDPVYPFVIDLPTLTPQKNVDALVAVPDPNRRDLPNPHRQGFLPVCNASIAVG